MQFSKIKVMLGYYGVVVVTFPIMFVVMFSSVIVSGSMYFTVTMIQGMFNQAIELGS